MTVTDTSPVIVYWRPGCPYCTGLRRRLRQLGVRTAEINIWDDPSGVAAVRGYAGGNETVPTVVIAGTAGIVVHAGGHQKLGWVLDAVAVAAYLAARLLRRIALAATVSVMARPSIRSTSPRSTIVT